MPRKLSEEEKKARKAIKAEEKKARKAEEKKARKAEKVASARAEAQKAGGPGAFVTERGNTMIRPGYGLNEPLGQAGWYPPAVRAAGEDLELVPRMDMRPISAPGTLPAPAGTAPRIAPPREAPRSTQRGTSTRGRGELERMTQLLGAKMPTAAELALGAHGVLTAFPRGSSAYSTSSGDLGSNAVRSTERSPAIDERGNVVRGHRASFGMSGRPTMAETVSAMAMVAGPTVVGSDPNPLGIIDTSKGPLQRPKQIKESREGTIGEFSPHNEVFGGRGPEVGKMYEHILSVDNQIKKLMMPRGAHGSGLAKNYGVSMPDMGMRDMSTPFVVGETKVTKVNPSEMDAHLASEADKRASASAKRRRAAKSEEGNA